MGTFPANLNLAYCYSVELEYVPQHDGLGEDEEEKEGDDVQGLDGVVPFLVYGFRVRAPSVAVRVRAVRVRVRVVTVPDAVGLLIQLPYGYAVLWCCIASAV